MCKAPKAHPLGVIAHGLVANTIVYILPGLSGCHSSLCNEEGPVLLRDKGKVRSLWPVAGYRVLEDESLCGLPRGADVSIPEICLGKGV